MSLLRPRAVLVISMLTLVGCYAPEAQEMMPHLEPATSTDSSPFQDRLPGVDYRPHPSDHPASGWFEATGRCTFGAPAEFYALGDSQVLAHRRGQCGLAGKSSVWMSWSKSSQALQWSIMTDPTSQPGTRIIAWQPGQGGEGPIDLPLGDAAALGFELFDSEIDWGSAWNEDEIQMWGALAQGASPTALELPTFADPASGRAQIEQFFDWQQTARQPDDWNAYLFDETSDSSQGLIQNCGGALRLGPCDPSFAIGLFTTIKIGLVDEAEAWTHRTQWAVPTNSPSVYAILRYFSHAVAVQPQVDCTQDSWGHQGLSYCAISGDGGISFNPLYDFPSDLQVPPSMTDDGSLWLGRFRGTDVTLTRYANGNPAQTLSVVAGASGGGLSPWFWLRVLLAVAAILSLLANPLYQILKALVINLFTRAPPLEEQDQPRWIPSDDPETQLSEERALWQEYFRQTGQPEPDPEWKPAPGGEGFGIPGWRENPCWWMGSEIFFDDDRLRSGTELMHNLVFRVVAAAANAENPDSDFASNYLEWTIVCRDAQGSHVSPRFSVGTYSPGAWMKLLAINIGHQDIGVTVPVAGELAYTTISGRHGTPLVTMRVLPFLVGIRRWGATGEYAADNAGHELLRAHSTVWFGPPLAPGEAFDPDDEALVARIEGSSASYRFHMTPYFRPPR